MDKMRKKGRRLVAAQPSGKWEGEGLILNVKLVFEGGCGYGDHFYPSLQRAVLETWSEEVCMVWFLPQLRT